MWQVVGRSARLASIVLLVALVHGGSSDALAQGFDAERFVPAAGAASDLTVESPVSTYHLALGLGLFLNYADDAVVETDTGTDDIVSRPLDDSMTADLIASLGLFKFAELGVHLPVHLLYRGDDYVGMGGSLSASGGVGDLRLVPKATLWGAGDLDRHFVLGLAVPVSLPTGNDEAFRGAGGVTITPLLLALAQLGRVGLAGNVGYVWRADSPPGLPWGNELRVALSTTFAMVPDAFDLQAEVVTGKQFGADDGPDFGLEALGAGVWRASQDLSVYLGGGVGAAKGLGTPDFRVLTGIRFSTGKPGRNGFADSDGDGIADRDDDCEREPEDHDGYLDTDGCPEPDNDEDGILDTDDECPELPEERGGDRDGCPTRTYVEIQEGQIIIVGKILFQTGSSELSPKSEQLLDQIAVAVKGHPEIGVIGIEGHTDNLGGAAINQRLSEERARSVKAALVKRGVDDSRIETHGFGPSQPIAPNDAPAGRAKNRRVEFVIKGRQE